MYHGCGCRWLRGVRGDTPLRLPVPLLQVFTVDNNPNGWAYDYNVNPNDSGEMYLSALYFTVRRTPL